MHYIPLGDTALRVSRLCLGCMTFGEPDRGRHAWTLPEESSRPLIQHAIEGGINFFDTANSYSDGAGCRRWSAGSAPGKVLPPDRRPAADPPLGLYHPD